MARERALTLEALRVMDAIDRRGSFAAAADELGRVPSALSYTMQKLEEELDVVLFDRSGHRTKFTNVGRMLLERGRSCWRRRISSPPMPKRCPAVGKRI
ncbi:D-malate degradation protein R [Raoultella terrigena]|uniref:D-malate degradation protein R n=1 Tax=Raoultella terrigena TaxID=577 RepID=A0A3P8JCM7_RAOTE|nr:D-malate degradation protein R [Raoultella terrigena]